MTQQVRRTYRNHRRGAWAAVLVVLVAAALAVVIPAFAAEDGAPILPPSVEGVTPTVVNVGGSNFSCTDPMSNPGIGPKDPSLMTFAVSNIPNSTTPDIWNAANTAGTSTPLPAGVTFTIKGVNGKDKGKKFGFSVTGARVFHIGSNGGSDTAWYDYPGNSGTKHPLGVSKDGLNASGAVDPVKYLHATAKDPADDSTLYNASWTTFCYKPIVKISGTVYGDTNSNGDQDGSETGTNGRTVSVTVGSTTTTTTTATESGQAGAYSFYVPTNSSYTVCAEQAETEAQTQPSGNTACGTTPDIAGYTGTAAAATSGLDFGITGGVLGACNAPLDAVGSTVGAATYTATVTGADCKIENQKLVMNTWNDSAGQYASLRPTTTFPECVVETAENCVNVLETMTWSFLPGSDPKVLKYSDDFPVESYEVMPFCKVDPESGTFAPAQILPQRADSKYHTSCLYSSTQTVTNEGGTWHIKRIDKAYSAQDGQRFY